MNHILYIPSWYPNQYDNLSGVFLRNKLKDFHLLLKMWELLLRFTEVLKVLILNRMN